MHPRRLTHVELQLLRQDREEVTTICKVELEDADSSEDYIKHLNGNAFDVQLILGLDRASFI
jgi:hypothetical protein